VVRLGSISWTYVVIPDQRSDRRMKVGKTKEKDPWNRIASLETAAGVRLKWFGFIRNSAHEKFLHAHLKEWRQVGEWFAAPDEALTATREYLLKHGELGKPYPLEEPKMVPIDLNEHTFAVQTMLPGFPYRVRPRSHLLRAVIDGHSIPTTASTGCVDYYTPLKYVESARRVMKGIDLDPASSDELNKSIGAAIHYTIDDDGLKQIWRGRVFLNPPWSGQADKFVNLLLSSYRHRTVEQAVLLLPSAYVDRKFMRPLLDCFPVCMTDHRIKYGGAGNCSTGGDAFYYLGPYRQRFIDEFTQYGPVLLRQLTSDEMSLGKAAE
jgi:hypothetical protein